MASRTTRARRFVVVSGTSVRARPERSCRDELHFVPGDVVDAAALPKHAPVREWLASGHWRPAKPREVSS